MCQVGRCIRAKVKRVSCINLRLLVRLQKLIELRKQLQKKYNQATFESQSETQKEDEFIISVRQLVLDNLDDDSFDLNARTATQHYWLEYRAR